MSEPTSHESQRAIGSYPVVRWIVGVIALVLALKFLVEPFVESVQHAITRGHERAKAEIAKTQLAKLSDTADAFRLVAQSVGPSVVHIDAMQPIDLLEKEVNDEWSLLNRHRPRPLRSTGQGSGVVVDTDGFILTNNHVIQDATAIRLKLSDGRLLDDCEVVGVDVLTDLAVLKVQAEGLVAAPWGDSDSLEVGDWVLAVGNPFGLDRSVTAGIVSAKQRRQVVDSLPYQDFLQTDAAVNPGNSGGPLVNLQGEVVGINTAIVGEAYQGISFAIPSLMARDVYQRLKTTGKVSRGWLGVSLQELTPELAESMKITAGRGVVVTSVFPHSPADQAGLESGDCVIEWNNEPVLDATELSLRVAKSAAGTAVIITVMRDGKTLELKAKVGERPSDLR
jgi:serine protease Do